jgi:hypothetical protein
MKKILAATVAVAALAFGPSAFAQMEQEGEWFVIDQQGGSKLVIGPANPEGSELLMAEGDARPADCPSGSFFQMADGTIVSCDDETAFFDLRESTAEELSNIQENIVNTEPYPETAQTLIPRDAAEAQSGESNTETTN